MWHRLSVRCLIVAVAVAAAMLGTGLTAGSSGDLQSQIAAGKSAAASLKKQIAADTAQIARTHESLSVVERRLASLRTQLNEREAQLVQVQHEFLAARNRLVDLENRLRVSSHALAANLVAQYEGSQPDLFSIIVEANGFTDLLERLNSLRAIARQDTQIVRNTRTARVAVKHQVVTLDALERHDRALTEQVLAQRNQVAALQLALLHRQIAEIQARQGAASKLSGLNSRVHKLEARAAAQAARAQTTGNANVGGIAVNTAGMVQPPPGAPAAVREVIAAGNAIATLPYIYGGGHASFHANGYDCSGSVSYALAAAGLVSSPMVSGQFETWGDPGPGRWITIYANAGHVWMTVAGWRFDTVALAEIGTRWARGGGEFAGFVVRHPPGL
jgi:peptidoglycan hydrolase CwlO-like protein